jgi:hypothetical protein
MDESFIIGVYSLVIQLSYGIDGPFSSMIYDDLPLSKNRFSTAIFKLPKVTGYIISTRVVR